MDDTAGGPPRKRPVHSVRATRWERGWELQVGDEGVTQCRTLAGADAQSRDYLATMHGGEPDDYRVSLDGVSGEFTYLVRVEPTEEGWWLLWVPEINHATQARFLGEADMMARDLIAVMTRQVADDLKLAWDVTEAERLADSDPSRAEEVDDFTDWLSVVNRAGETISIEQLETDLEND